MHAALMSTTMSSICRNAADGNGASVGVTQYATRTCAGCPRTSKWALLVGHGVSTIKKALDAANPTSNGETLADLTKFMAKHRIDSYETLPAALAYKKTMKAKKAGKQTATHVLPHHTQCSFRY